MSLLAACASEEEPPRSPHPYDHVLTEGQRHVPNPDVTLRREYWLVVQDERRGTFAMAPRPDGDPRIAAECATKGPLAAMFEGAALCRQASATTVARVNALTRDEAMTTSTFLHARLRFVTAFGGVEPYPLRTDIIDVCRSSPAARAGALRSLCDEELYWAEQELRPAIARSYTPEEAAALAAELNALYGIDGSGALAHPVPAQGFEP